MSLILNFFAALSDCFCETHPETLVVYKLFLTNKTREQIEQYFGNWVIKNVDQIVRRSANLSDMVLGENVPTINLRAILSHPIGIQNESSIWAHLQVIVDQYCPVVPQKSATDVISSLMNKISISMQSVETIDDEPPKPGDVMKNLFKPDVFAGILEHVQKEMSEQPHVTPQELIMAATQLLSNPENM